MSTARVGGKAPRKLVHGPLARTRKPAAAARAHRRLRPGQLAIREIRKLQKGSNTLLSRAPFRRLVREIALDIDPNLRFQGAAMDALQESAEAVLVSMFQDGNKLALHAGRTTIFSEDMELAAEIRRDQLKP